MYFTGITDEWTKLTGRNAGKSVISVTILLNCIRVH